MQALVDLVEATVKDKEGTFQLMFDERDKELDDFVMEDLSNSKNDWVNVKVDK